MSMVFAPSMLAMANGPDRSAGVLRRAGDVLLNGVWHCEVVEMPRRVISVPMSVIYYCSGCIVHRFIDRVPKYKPFLH